MIVIDAGHGGTDPGASGNGIIEKEYNKLISDYMYNRFVELGVPVVRTREGDETLTPEARTNLIKNAFGNDPNVVVLSNHLNAGGGDGAEVIYALRNDDTLSKLILQELESEGQNIRKWYQRRLPSDPSKDYYFIHRLTGNTEPVLIEYGFLDNGEDANFIKNNWQRLAEAVVRAVSIYKNLPYDGTLNEILYTVKSGDSLASIAQKYGTTVDAIKDINGKTTNIVSVGEELIIPRGTGSVSTTTKYDTYTVKRGDSLYSIANRYNTSVAELKSLNNLTSNMLSIGQVLRLPGTQTTTTITSPSNTYIVKRGDSLYSIANSYGTTVDALKSLNGLTSNTLSIGQVLRLPGSETTTISPSTGTYTVKKGDSLYSIARDYGTTVDAIKSLNNLTSNTLSIGQVLRLPGNETNTGLTGNTYVVQLGDSLYSLSKRYNTTIDQIKNLNNLSSDVLSVGQQLIIPIAGTTSNALYTVKRGDSLYSIARDNGTTVTALKSANNLTSDVLSIGQEIIIPN